MTDTKHTPGPWVLKTHHRQGYDRLVPVWYVSAQNDVGIAVQPSFSNPKTEEADARLIAAAPDLLKALVDLNAGILPSAESNASGNPEWEYVDQRIKAARAAIALALGGTP